MARQIKTRVKVDKTDWADFRGDMLVAGVFEGTKRLPTGLKTLDEAAGKVISHVFKTGDFKGKVNESTTLYLSSNKNCDRLVLVGLGKKEKFDLTILRQAAATAARLADKLGAAKVGLGLHQWIGAKWDERTVGQALAEGVIVGRYSFSDHFTKADDEHKSAGSLTVSLLEPDTKKAQDLNKGSKIGATIAEAQNTTRMFANRPGNDINPPVLAREAQKLARQTGLKCKVFDDKQLAQKKMNGILAVGGGSASKPRLIMLEHYGRRGQKPAKARPDVVVVGKAITFDSGGLSLKPSSVMLKMKFDKSGGCAVLGIMEAVANLNLPLHVVGLVPAAENMPSHTSYRPDDIVKTYSGKTVEIQNTDAEGRMILSDALAYAAEMKPKAIIDMATLTGACVIALGAHKAALFSNNDALRKQLEKASENSGEPVWPMPMGDEYLEQMKSKVADLRNVGGREAGSCTAAAFLHEFVGDVPWAHIDIAGVADTDSANPWRAVGATGFAVRLVVDYLRNV